MKLPRLAPAPQSRELTQAFYGYRRRPRLKPGELFFTENLSTRDFPLLSTRPRRGMVRRLAEPQGLIAKDKLCWVDGGVLYHGGEPTPLTGLAPGRKQLVGMGAYVCVFPDKLYYNTQNPEDYGPMEFVRTLTGTVRYALCTLSGEELSCTASESPPEGPANGACWYDSGTGVLKLYSAAQDTWEPVALPCTKLSFPGLDFPLSAHLQENDGVELRGTAFPETLDGVRTLCAVGADYLVVPGLIDPRQAPEGRGSVRVARELPELDFVCECRNRLWGCRYGPGPDGKPVNEICCSALGDFKNWRVYRGLSTDSWAASVGSDGPWTGAVNFLGCPTFFKEDRIHRVAVSASGAHSVQELEARGVQRGAEKSLALVDEQLFYLSRSGVLAYQGGFPRAVGEALGEESYTEAVGGALGSCYYLSAKDAAGRWSLFVCDAARGLWSREDELQLTDLAPLDGSLFALDASGLLWDLAGAVGERETRLPWIAQTGLLDYEQPDRRYLSRLELMLSAPRGTRLALFVQYDGDGVWRPGGELRFRGRNAVSLPLRPRRCRYLALRLEGEGEVQIYSLTRVLERSGETT